MGTACSGNTIVLAPSGKTSMWPSEVPVPVWLSVYDIGTWVIWKRVNKVLRPLGTGAFHCGVAVHGREWSYGDSRDECNATNSVQSLNDAATGVFWNSPFSCEGHTFVESVCMGQITMPESEVLRAVEKLSQLWTASEYHTFRHNCCHFSIELCRVLGVGPVPEWVSHLAGVTSTIITEGQQVCTCRRLRLHCPMCCRKEGPCCPTQVLKEDDTERGGEILKDPS
mmetsp:Transcript_137852/g.274855  ORF Transcript_137852/g.274855 Transcript_137852/m.274855 type:complete len:225 (-) Transcript_137852:23-697(-)